MHIYQQQTQPPIPSYARLPVGARVRCNSTKRNPLPTLSYAVQPIGTHLLRYHRQFSQLERTSYATICTSTNRNAPPALPYSSQWETHLLRYHMRFYEQYPTFDAFPPTGLHLLRYHVDSLPVRIHLPTQSALSTHMKHPPTRG